METINGDSDGLDQPPSPPRKFSFSIAGLFVLAVCYTLYFAQEILIPVTAAVILALLLQPVVRFLRRAKVPEPIGAGVVVLAFFAVLTVGIYFLSDPAAKWISQMPDVVAEVQEKIKGPIKQIKDAKEEIEDMVEETQADPKAAPRNSSQRSKAPEAKSEQAPAETARVSLLEVFTRTLPILRDVGWSLLIVFVLLYFLLASGTTMRENIILALPTFRDKKRALAVTRDVERGVSGHLATVTLINIGLGVAIGLAMLAAGLPNPALWGAMAALLNFIPYLGAIAGTVVVTIVGLVTFDGLMEALIPPLVYIAINSLEGHLVTPMVLSHRLTISPIAVFLSVIFWGWIWGVPGALMAVPILICLKVVCGANKRLAPVSQFLSGRSLRQEGPNAPTA
jgi:predicted PurR-regulated permease PerM